MLVDYAGAELEVDFQREYGIGLHEYVEGRRPWSQLVRLAAALPTASRYKNKLLQDRALAALFPVDESGAVELDFVDETPIVSALRGMQDSLNQLIWVTAGNPNARMPSPVPRPRSASMVLQDEAVDREVDKVIFALTGEAL